MSDRDTGVTLIIVGVVLMAAGFLPFLWPLCGVGVLLLIVGLILTIASPGRPAYYSPPYAQPYYAYPPAVTAPTGPQAPPACPACGQPLAWIAQYARWYCPRCQQYR